MLTMGNKDVLIALGLFDVSKASMGIEAAGVVRRIGTQVKDLRIGDRVILFGTRCFSTVITTSEQLCAKMADELSFDDGATMPCVYGTVIYSFVDVGRLETGQVSAPCQRCETSSASEADLI